MPLPLCGSGGRTFRISAAIWPTCCLSFPRTMIVVAFGTSNSMPSPGATPTGGASPPPGLLVVPAHDDRRRVRHLELDALPRRYRHRVRVPDLQVYVPPLERGPVADARDVQRPREPVRNTGNGVLEQGAREAVHRPARRRGVAAL